ncbi:uncharacterized protein LOC100208449 [Hydra vulgaris]|uniref:Uncharacterized protein LOC100208449 n=1 Tax=Hydra vulgaris TaxID=6087 RepID=A0ABM4C2M7_HYDVU
MKTFNFIVFFIYIKGLLADQCPNSTQPSLSQCSLNINIQYWNVQPYETIFKSIIETAVRSCCGDCVNFTYNIPVSDSEALKALIGANYSDIAFPIYGDMVTTTFQNYPYFPIVESPGVIYIQKNVKVGQSASAVISAVLQGWPVLVLTVIMAALSGIIMWALDSYWNPTEFPSSFFKGSWEGFWWAFVSMTTVGYGDRAPKSFVARVFAFFWVLVGLVIISIFTATVTTSLTTLSLSNDVTLYGTNVVAMNNSQEQRYGIQSNAVVKPVSNIEEFVDQIINKGSGSDAINGGLIDSYVAGNYNKKLNKTHVYVSEVFDYQYAYGFVITNKLNGPPMEQCLRKTLSLMDSLITNTIQQMMTAIPKPDQSAAEQKSSSLFDPNSAIFQQAVFICLGIIFFLTVCGVAWEYCYWRPKQKINEATDKEEEQFDTPHSTFEELVASQCQELEDAMVTEVMTFYKAFNKKLDEIRQRNLRENYGEKDPKWLEGSNIGLKTF